MLADFGIDGDRGRRATPACGSATRRSRRSACGSRAAARGTASRSTSIPTSRCSTTSCRAASATAGVTSMARLLGDRAGDARRSSTRSSRGSPRRSASTTVDRQDVAWQAAPTPRARRAARRRSPVRLLGRLAAAGVEVDPTRRAGRSGCGCAPASATSYRELKRLVRDLDLHTVCEEAGCPNIYECWADRTATFMILGDRCTRACGFCLVDTRKPLAARPRRAARASPTRSRTLGLAHAVITSVARDDLARRRRVGVRGDRSTRSARASPETDGRGADLRLQGRRRRRSTTIFAARPDVLNHNLETVARLQRAARPSAGYARSLARARPGQGRRARHEVGDHPRHGRDRRRGARRDRRPARRSASTSSRSASTCGRRRTHLPVARWWTPDEFAALARLRARRSASRTSSRARSCAPATTPATESIGWSRRVA